MSDISNKESLCLRTVFIDPNIPDHDLLMMTLNTILNKTDNSDEIFIHISSYLQSFEKLYKENQRPDILYLIDKSREYFKPLENKDEWTDTFNIFESVLKSIIIEAGDLEKCIGDPKKYKYVWLICYFRVIFEIFYEKYIYYKKPHYSTRILEREPSWSVFLDAFRKGDYLFMRL